MTSSRRKTVVRLLFAGLAVYAFLLPFLGHLVDHHYAERQPGHGHIYLGHGGLDHLHLHELPHEHGGDHAHNDPHVHDHSHDHHFHPGEGPDGVVFLGPREGFAGIAQITTSAAQVEVDFDYAEDPGPPFGGVIDNVMRSQASTAPPKRPPRV